MFFEWLLPHDACPWSSTPRGHHTSQTLTWHSGHWPRTIDKEQLLRNTSCALTDIALNLPTVSAREPLCCWLGLKCLRHGLWLWWSDLPLSLYLYLAFFFFLSLSLSLSLSILPLHPYIAWFGCSLVARAIRNAIRANRFARIIRNCHPYFYSASGRFARIARISDSRESRH